MAWKPWEKKKEFKFKERKEKKELSPAQKQENTLMTKNYNTIIIEKEYVENDNGERVVKTDDRGKSIDKLNKDGDLVTRVENPVIEKLIDNLENKIKEESNPFRVMETRLKIKIVTLCSNLDMPHLGYQPRDSTKEVQKAKKAIYNSNIYAVQKMTLKGLANVTDVVINGVAAITNGLKKFGSAVSSVFNKLTPSSKKTPKLEIESSAKGEPEMQQSKQQSTKQQLNQNQSVDLGRSSEVQNIRNKLVQENKIPPPSLTTTPKALAEAQQKKSKKQPKRLPPPLKTTAPTPTPTNSKPKETGMGR